VVALSGAERTARYRARHPEHVSTYIHSDRHREICRDATARWRARNPITPKPKKPKVTDEHKRKVGREAMRRYHCKLKGFVPCDVSCAESLIRI